MVTQLQPLIKSLETLRNQSGSKLIENLGVIIEKELNITDKKFETTVKVLEIPTYNGSVELLRLERICLAFLKG